MTPSGVVSFIEGKEMVEKRIVCRFSMEKLERMDFFSIFAEEKRIK